jgi:cyclopropane fatty-acyl-phospholipid synthase-like methyltransferase
MDNEAAILKNKYGFENPFKPDALSEKALSFLKPNGELLDAGCGEGADSVYYAKNGFNVTSIDGNKAWLNRLRAYRKNNQPLNISVRRRDLVHYHYPFQFYDAVSSLLVGCCMKKSEFEIMLAALKRSVKPRGIIIMSLRNYLDPEYKEYSATEKMIEPNTFHKKEDCCKTRYYIEKNRLKELLSDFEILHYFEGLVPDKYEETSEHGDSNIICRRLH